jgi:WD40 repeat protein
MPSISSCLTMVDLDGLAKGRLPAAEVERLRLHLGHCPRCAERFRAFFGDGTTLQDVADRPADKGGTSVVSPSALEPASTPPRQLRIGAYEVLSELGRGGMGVVYRARHQRLGHEVALKLILSGEHAGAQGLARFEIEAAAVAKLKHAGIVHIHEYGEHDGSPFFALELVEGGSLAGRLKKSGPLPAAEAADLVERLARAMQHAHEAGIIHRDLKPANVLLTQEGEPKVTDFGLAKQAGGRADLSRSGAIMGTPAYMAPEQGEGKNRETGPAADIYALGGILYECLTGRTPFQGHTPYEVLVKLLTQEPPAPRRLVRGLPRDLETVCLRCLEKDPARRYASAAALADDLGRFRRGEPVAARPVGPLGRAWRWAQRNPAVAGLLAAAATILVAGATVATFFAVEADHKATEAERQREQADTQRRRAEGLVTALEKSVKEKGEETSRAIREKEQARSALKTAQLLRVEAVGERDPELGFRLLHDESVWPTAERDFAWGVYNRWCLQKDEPRRLERVSLPGHGGGARSATFSPDGKTLASASADNTITLWDAATGQERASLRGHTSYVNSVRFSPDGKMLASGSSDRTIKLWDAATGRGRASLMGHTDLVSSVAFSPDGKTLASAGHDAAIKLWDLATGKERASLTHAGLVNSMCFSPGGKTLALACMNRTVELWEVATGQLQATLKGHSGAVSSVAFSPDGKTLASSASDDKTIKLWDVDTGQERASLRGHTESVHSVAFSPDGKTLASASADKTIRLWDLATGQERCALRGHTDWVRSVEFGPDGKTLASGSWDKTIKMWDAATGQERASLTGHTDIIISVAYSPDGKTLASADYDKTIKLWDVATGQERASLRGHTESIYSVSLSPDGKTLASGGGGLLQKVGEVKLWDLATGRERASLSGHTESVNSVCFSPDGKTLASASRDETVKLWDAATGRERATLKGHTSTILSVAYSPDGKTLASGSVDKTIKLWDAATGRERATLKGHTDSVTSVCFSPDGKTLASAGCDKTIRLWDVATGRERASLRGHTEKVNSVSFSPDGKTLASAGDDKMVKLWDVTPYLPRWWRPSRALQGR